MAGGTAMHCRPRLFLRALLVAVFSVALAASVGAVPEEDIVAHVSTVALAALRDTEGLLKEVSEAEAHALGASGRSPLEAYPAVNDKVGQLFEAALLALRHLAAAHAVDSSVPLTPRELRDLATLEGQIVDVLTAQAKEPVFWWHGPKWMIIGKLKGIFRADVLSRLRALAGPEGAEGKLKRYGDEAVATLAKAGEPASKTAIDLAVIGAKVPAIGLAVGDAECGAQQGCDVAGMLAAIRAVSKQPAHLLVLPCETEALKNIRTSLHSGSDKKLFVSFVVNGNLAEQGPQAVVAKVVASLKLLGLESFDSLWLPYDSFKKRMWPHTKEMLALMFEQKTIARYGVHAPARSAALAKKLLDRQPTPAAWLTPHDVVLPAAPEALEAARNLSVVPVALPRYAGAPGAVARLYLQTAAGESSSDQQAAAIRWTLAQGLALTLRPGPFAAAAPGLVSALGGFAAEGPSPLSGAATRILDALGVASDLAPAAPAQPAAAAAAAAAPPVDELRDALQRGRHAISQARVDVVAQVAQDAPAATDRPSAAEAGPGVGAATLKGLDEQAQAYKRNNHVIYRENFFDEATWAAIVEETKRLWKSKDMDPNCNLDGKNRLGGYILDHNHRNTSLYRLIYGNEQFRRWVSAVNGEGDMWPSDFPIELREYGRDSQGMGCHPDLQMYAVAKKDLEFAVTVDNDSKCQVTFYDAQRKVHKVNTKANSVMMVRANAAEHCVSPTEGGSRQILKFIYVGDYRKSDTFWQYTGNECGDENPNRRMMELRREPDSDHHTHSSILEL